MHKIREVLRLHSDVGLTNRAIAESCHMSHSTVGDYLHRAKQASLTWPPGKCWTLRCPWPSSAPVT